MASAEGRLSVIYMRLMRPTWFTVGRAVAINVEANNIRQWHCCGRYADRSLKTETGRCAPCWRCVVIHLRCGVRFSPNINRQWLESMKY